MSSDDNASADPRLKIRPGTKLGKLAPDYNIRFLLNFFRFDRIRYLRQDVQEQSSLMMRKKLHELGAGGHGRNRLSAGFCFTHG